MTYQKLLIKIREYIGMKGTSKPKCFSRDDIMVCFCGKCKQKDYELPEDFSILLAKRCTETYKEYNRK